MTQIKTGDKVKVKRGRCGEGQKGKVMQVWESEVFGMAAMVKWNLPMGGKGTAFFSDLELNQQGEQR